MDRKVNIDAQLVEHGTQQVEFADVLIINKVDLVDNYELGEIQSLLQTLNPYARILISEQGRIDPRLILNTGRFDFERAAQSPGWRVRLREDVHSETDEYGISSVVFKARRPFHPARFWEALHGDWPGVVRAKNFFWLATRLDRMGVWSQAGPVARIQGGNIWWAAVPETSRPQDESFKTNLERIWDAEVGDCRQELVLAATRTLTLNESRPRFLEVFKWRKLPACGPRISASEPS